MEMRIFEDNIAVESDEGGIYTQYQWMKTAGLALRAALAMPLID